MYFKSNCQPIISADTQYWI